MPVYPHADEFCGNVLAKRSKDFYLARQISVCVGRGWRLTLRSTTGRIRASQ